MTDEEHKRYHLEVALEGCGVEGCDFSQALALHFRALEEATDEQVQPGMALPLDAAERSTGHTEASAGSVDDMKERSMAEHSPLPEDLSDHDDPVVQAILTAWLPHIVRITSLRQYVDGNQRVLMAQLAAHALSQDLCRDPAHSEPFACYRQAEGGFVCESTFQLETLLYAIPSNGEGAAFRWNEGVLEHLVDDRWLPLYASDPHTA